MPEHNAGRLNPFEAVQAQIDATAEVMQLDPAIYDLLREPLRELHVRLPITMDDGATRIFRGFRVQYNDARGPTKGGLRMHPNESIDTARALAARMTWRCAVVDLPLGGGAGSIVCNAREMSQGELERLSRAYIRQVVRMLGDKADIPAQDVYTTPQVIGWMMDEFSMLRGYYDPGVISGKPLPQSGDSLRDDATARGCVICIREAAKTAGIAPDGLTLAIQGFGSAGQAVATQTHALGGARVIAVSDGQGGIYAPGGLDVAAVIRHQAHTGSVTGFPGADTISDADLLTLAVDVLVPSALEGAITADSAPTVRARIIAELANGPITPEADPILHDRGALVIPDLLCNAGGVIVSYFEMVQNTYDYAWDAETVTTRLDRKLRESFRAMMHKAQELGVPTRRGAYALALARVAEAVRLRGWA